MRKLGFSAGASLGAAYGPLGMAAGGMLGGAAGGLISGWSGNGDYKVSRNSMLSPNGQIAQFSSAGGQTIVVRHREFIGTLAGSPGFTVQMALPINPGIDTTFPWLAPIASKFQQYQVKGMVYQYLPTSGTFNGSTAALGAVMFQTTYRATDTAPASKVELLNEYWSSENVASNTLLHAIECNPKENPFNVHYVRTNEITSGEPLMYDIGKTFIATQGMNDTATVGDIWVTYEIELKKPLVVSPVISPSNCTLLALSGGLSSTNFFTATTSTYLQGPTNTALLLGRVITLPSNAPIARTYYVSVTLVGTSMTGGMTITLAAGLTAGTVNFGEVIGTTTSTASHGAIINVPASTALPTITYTSLTGGTVDAAYVVILDL
jgi:hypothetical protein